MQSGFSRSAVPLSQMACCGLNHFKALFSHQCLAANACVNRASNSIAGAAAYFGAGNQAERSHQMRIRKTFITAVAVTIAATFSPLQLTAAFNPGSQPASEKLVQPIKM